MTQASVGYGHLGPHHCRAAYTTMTCYCFCCCCCYKLLSVHDLRHTSLQSHPAATLSLCSSILRSGGKTCSIQWSRCSRVRIDLSASLLFRMRRSRSDATPRCIQSAAIEAIQQRLKIKYVTEDIHYSSSDDSGKLQHQFTSISSDILSLLQPLPKTPCVYLGCRAGLLCQRHSQMIDWNDSYPK